MPEFDLARQAARNIVIELYKDSRVLDNPKKLSSRSGHSESLVEEAIQNVRSSENDSVDHTIVVDPRYVGYSFPSYMFVESENSLSDAIAAGDDDFAQPWKALMLGTTLGQYDLIHRRVDQDRYANARFTVRAKNGPNLNFFENQETYPIFEIRRWHGQDRDESLRSKPADLGSLELEVLRRLMQDSTRSDHEISEAIKAGIKQGHTDTLVEDLNRIGTENVGDARQSLLDNDVLLGYSVDYDLEDMGWNRAVMGISLKPGYSDEGHDAAVEKLMSFDDDMGKGVDAPLNNFTLPYITSGLGQSWADLMLEIIVSDTSDINKIASRIREEIESVESTRTHLMTKSLMDDSITVDNWHQIASNNHQH